MLAEWSVAGKADQMRPIVALLLVVALVPTACRPEPKGAVRALIISGEPKIRDPSLGPLSLSDAVLLQNVAQGLVSFDASGNIVPGLAERWNVSDDGLTYIFRLASTQWPDGRKITAEQVARLIKRQLAARSRNTLKDTAGAIEDVVAMTDRVIEIQLVAPRPNLLALLAQPELAILRGNDGSGPFRAVWTGGPGGEVHLLREVVSSDEEQTKHEEVLLAGASASDAINDFLASKTDLVLGGTFADLPLTRRVRFSGGALRYDPAAGLFGLVPARSGGHLDNVDARRLLAEALDRANFVSELGVPGLAPRATLLEPGLDGLLAPAAPAWFEAPLADRLASLRARSERLFGKTKPVIKVVLPQGPGADLLLQELQLDWGAIGVTVQRAQNATAADLLLVDEVAPTTSPAWFVRRFRCAVAPVCDAQADQLMETARQMPVPDQRYALLAQAAARIDDMQLYIPIAAPIRWSLVSGRVQGFSGNRYARHTLSDLEQQPARD
ncbi:MAG TPA: ABC transporter substrate-binding protein [Sphingomicrobium sp.]|nr:ABC transporter substrate-binding protein [Sphingomicrobium sp.]